MSLRKKLLERKSDKELYEIMNTTKNKDIRNLAFEIVFERDQHKKLQNLKLG